MLSVIASQYAEQSKTPGFQVKFRGCLSGASHVHHDSARAPRIWPSYDLCAWRAPASLTTWEASVLSSRREGQVEDTCAQNLQKENKNCLLVWITWLQCDLIPNVHNDLIPFSQSSMRQTLRAVFQRKKERSCWCSYSVVGAHASNTVGAQ